MKKTIGIGLAGLGTVGSGVYEILEKNKKILQDRSGKELKINHIFTRSLDKKRKIKVKKQLLTNQYQDLLKNPDNDIIIELIGGTSLAKTLVIAALKAGKHVVTANKALIASHGKELFELASQHKVALLFEAAVAGGIPILRSLREGLVANEIQSLHGILNGTCNYILTKMEEEHWSFQDALKKAQELGYAEADPKMDIDGTDSVQKLAILFSLAYGSYLDYRQIPYEGIEDVHLFDIQTAQNFGFKVKLLASVINNQGQFWVQCSPTLVPDHSMLAAVGGAQNAILVEGDSVGPSLSYGAGAGMGPTASAVVADVIELARSAGAKASYMPPPLGHYTLVKNAKTMTSQTQMSLRFYLRLWVEDKAGVLSKLTGILGKYGISIRAVHQEEKSSGKKLPLVIFTHHALESRLDKALQKMTSLNFVKGKTLKMPILEDL